MGLRRIGMLGGLLMLADLPAAWAQEPPVPLLHGEVADLERCLVETPDNPRSCAGRLANICQEQPDGSTTPGIVACIQQETDLWDRILNARYSLKMEATRQRLYDGGPDSLASLRDAQRKWIAYRDAECGRVLDYWSAGTIRGPAYASCMLELTAGRAIDFDPAQNR